jgi:mRNA interferase MazF
MIWIDCNPQAGRAMKDMHPFAVKFNGPRGVASYILGHQPKSFDWRAKPHPLKKVPEDAYMRACETLNQIIAIAS